MAGALSESQPQVTKQVTFTELHSSVQVVLSDNDLLTEILLRLPVLSLLPLKLVSKQWLSLIKSSHFIKFHGNRNPNLEQTPSGLFVMDNHFVRYLCVQFHTANFSPLAISFPFRSSERYVEMLHSCNGLLLCFIRPLKLFVYNPSTNQFKLLPEDHYSKLDKLFSAAKLAYDPDKSPHYKVVHAVTVHDIVQPSVKIQTYSSETGDWSVYPDRFPKLAFNDFLNGVYWNGAIHWLDTYNQDLHYKLDVNLVVLTTILQPANLDINLRIDFDRKLFESRGCLLLVCGTLTVSTRKRHLNVYEMRNESLVWSLRYVIDVDYIKTLVPETWEMLIKWDFVRCIVLGEREEDSFIVLEISRKFLQYNIMLKSLYTIYDLLPPGFSSHYFPFIPSLAGV